MSWLSDLLTGNSSDKRAAERAKKTQEEQKANLLRVSKQAIQTGTPQQQQKAQRILSNKSWTVDNSFKPAYNNDPLKNATGTVGLGLYRSAVGTGQGLSGLYDLATPGKGTNRLSKALDVKAKRADEIATQQNRSGFGYKGAQFFGDALTFTGGAPVIKGASAVLGTGAKMIPGASKVIAPTTNLVSKVSKPLTAVSTPVSKGIATTTANLANKGAGGRIAAQAIQTGVSKPQLMNTGVDMGLGLGQMASKGQDIGWKDVALQGGISAGFGVGMPAAAQAVKEVIQPTTKLVTGMARGAQNINTPPNINNPLAPKMVTPDGQMVSVPKAREVNARSESVVPYKGREAVNIDEYITDTAPRGVDDRSFIRNAILGKFKNKKITLSNGNEATVGRNEAGKLSGKSYKEQLPEHLDAKVNSSMYVDELGVTVRNLRPDRNRKNLKSNAPSIEKGDITIISRGVPHEAELVIRKYPDGSYRIYDVIVPKENTPSRVGVSAEHQVIRGDSTDTIPNNTTVVNSTIQKLKDLDKKLGQKGSVPNPLVNPDGTPRIGKGAPIEKTPSPFEKALPQATATIEKPKVGKATSRKVPQISEEMAVSKTGEQGIGSTVIPKNLL